MNKKINIASIVFYIIVTSIFSSFITYRVMSGDDLLAFMGAITGVSGAFFIFKMGDKKSKEEKKEKEIKELEYKRNLLFTMLEYTIIQTNIVTNSINKYYHQNCDEYLAHKYNLVGEFKADLLKTIFISDKNDCEELFDYYSKIDKIFLDMLNKYKIPERVVYIDDWYNYLDCIEDAEEIQTIITWINLIKYSDVGSDSYTYMFLSNREEVDNLIKKYYSKAITEGVRGKYTTP
ncbi:MAG: hypothetical protein ACRCW0_08990 [Clostridium sp.]